MPLITTKGAASAQGFGEFTKTGEAVYIESCFSTYLYTGNGSTQTITNGIDLSGKGGLVWLKERGSSSNHVLRSTGMDSAEYLRSNGTDFYGGVTNTFNSDGFTTSLSTASSTYASWTFRKQAKFFDVVTYTGNGSNRTISHNLGSVPGCIIVKRLSISDWQVYHRSLANTEYMVLNSTAAKATGTTRWNSTTPTSTEFSLGTDTSVNASGGTYVAYLFAHDAGGFGLSGTDNVISCGSYTGNGSSTGPTVTLGYEPQWLMIKAADRAQDWFMFDTMRGLTATGGTEEYLLANTSDAAGSGAFGINPTATGFGVNTAGTSFNASGEKYIYIAIRRGPMKVPTSGTSVFAPVTYAGDATINRAVSVGFPVDFALVKNRTSVVYNATRDRLVGNALFINASSTGGTNATNNYGFTGPLQNTHYIPESGTAWNASANNYILEAFRRAPSFMDVVCYTGTGSATSFTHNLTVAPQLMFIVSRSLSQNWNVYAEPLGNTNYLVSNLTDPYGTSSTRWNNTSPTATQFTVGTQATVNSSGATYVAYLFATCAGVSKVGSYTGTGTTLQIDCGFTGGARFILIKRTDSTGDWYVYDTARGIVAGNDPYLFLNSTAAEVTNTDYVDPYNAGFELSSTAPAGLNASGGSFVFLAVA